MKWISFKEQWPPRVEDILIWDNDKPHGRMIGIGFLSQTEEPLNVSCRGCCSNCYDVIEEKGIVLKYYYICFQDHFTILLKDVLKRDFYWMFVPEFKK